MNQCNYCHWQRMKKYGFRRATRKEQKRLWKVRPEHKGTIIDGGVVILDKDGKFACWFATLPKHCCC